MSPPSIRSTVREALLRERYRGGQAFVVVPRIGDLPEIEAFLAEQVPELRVVTAHGQLAAAELDERMNAFYDGRHDVLLSTSIVESGLDIPAANTLIVIACRHVRPRPALPAPRQGRALEDARLCLFHAPSPASR
ncbi:MAG: hypothetical protein KatS3mg118_2300 [Paracoccaceae bacterium]|nr:MAG: hypothetical protein KatS3mg118_2300 [Paracoccaceae bacterium]